MSSLYLNRLSHDEIEKLRKDLFEAQNGKCFICEKDIDLRIHEGQLDIDHIVPIKVGGKDDPINFALTHSSCNRSKQDSDLNVARILCRFDDIKSSAYSDNRGPNLNDILRYYSGSQNTLNFIREKNLVKYSMPDIGRNEIYEAPIFKDELSGFEYFFIKIPIQYLYHDDRINPRTIGSNISKLIKEFYLKRPQLHISLAWIEIETGNKVKIKVFDGQHKAAAQILLGIKELPVRVFINPNESVLLRTNTNAGTTLSQIAFNKSVQRHLGSFLYEEKINQFKSDTKKANDDFSFSERDLIVYFRGESREMKRYILDAVRDSITHNTDNKLKEYIDFGGRGKEKPLSYSTIEKTFYSFFIYQQALETPLSYLEEQDQNPRFLEGSQILKLMNLIAEEILVGKYDMDIGTGIESNISKGEDYPLDHIRACRMCKEEILYNWLKYIGQIARNYFITNGKPIEENRLFQYYFPEPLWNSIEVFIRNLSNMPLWINRELASTVFGGKQNYAFWQTIFETGRTIQGVQILPQSLNLMEMLKP